MFLSSVEEIRDGSEGRDRRSSSRPQSVVEVSNERGRGPGSEARDASERSPSRDRELPPPLQDRFGDLSFHLLTDV